MLLIPLSVHSGTFPTPDLLLHISCGFLKKLCMQACRFCIGCTARESPREKMICLLEVHLQWDARRQPSAWRWLGSPGLICSWKEEPPSSWNFLHLEGQIHGRSSFPVCLFLCSVQSLSCPRSITSILLTTSLLPVDSSLRIPSLKSGPSAKFQADSKLHQLLPDLEDMGPGPTLAVIYQLRGLLQDPLSLRLFCK